MKLDFSQTNTYVREKARWNNSYFSLNVMQMLKTAQSQQLAWETPLTTTALMPTVQKRLWRINKQC